MTFFYLLCFILLVAGVAFLLELTPEGITDDLMKLIAPKQTLRDKVLIAHGKKKSRRMTKELLHIREALEATGKANQFTAACCASILLMILGFERIAVDGFDSFKLKVSTAEVTEKPRCRVKQFYLSSAEYTVVFPIRLSVFVSFALPDNTVTFNSEKTFGVDFYYTLTVIV